MEQSLLFGCLRPGMNVQHLLTGLEQIGPNTHLPVVCPAWSLIHFVNASTGKLVGDRSASKCGQGCRRVTSGMLTPVWMRIILPL